MTQPTYQASANADAARARIEQINNELRTIDADAAGQPLSAAAQADWDELETERTWREEEHATLVRRARLEASRERWNSAQFVRGVDPFADDPRVLQGDAVYSRAMTVVDDRVTGGHLRDDQKERLQTTLRARTGDTDGELIGQLLLATEHPAYRSAFQRSAASQSPAFMPEEVHAIDQVRQIKRAMSVGTDSAGGFAVPVLIDPTIILTAQGSTNDILRLARVETITNDTWRGLSSAGVSWSFRAEGATTADNSPTIGQPEVQTRRADGFIPFSIEVGMDWPGFAERMAELLESGYDELLAEKLTTGTSGSNEPNGLVSSVDATTAARIEVTTAGTIGAPDVYDLWAALPQRHRRSMSTAFMSSTDVQNAVRQLGTTDPNFSVNITESAIPRLFGREYPMNDYMSALVAGTGTQPLLLLGDFRGYLVAQRAGMNVEFVPTLFDVTNNRPTGQRGWFAWARVGAGVVDSSAFKILRNNDGA